MLSGVHNRHLSLNSSIPSVTKLKAMRGKYGRISISDLQFVNFQEPLILAVNRKGDTSPVKRMRHVSHFVNENTVIGLTTHELCMQKDSR